MTHDVTDQTSAAETTSTWHARAADLALPTYALLNGTRRPAADGRSYARLNPATGAHLATIAACGEADVDAAVAAARACFDRGDWAGLDPQTRKARMLAWATLIEQHSDELALLETLEIGKPISAARGETPACAATIRWYAEAIDKLYDEVAPTGASDLATITHEPAGVAAAVIPWNYPTIIASWKLGPALAAGNAVILKPAEQAAMACIRLGELAIEAGLPAGALQVLPGTGPVTGGALGRHPDVDVVAFTGSGEIGRRFLEYAAQSNLKRVALECGGKSPQIVTRDCPDLDAAAEAVAYGIWYNQGETCHAGSRLIVDPAVKEELLERLERWAAHFAPGDPLDPETAMGPIVDADQRQNVRDHIDAARDAGATVRGPGCAVPGDGYYVAPTILEGLPHDAAAVREEIFGPVLVVQECAELDASIRMANDTPYGLAASVWTERIADAHRAARRLRAGTVWINTYDQASPATPFGGYKESGIGRDRSLHAFEKFTETKTTWLALA